MPDATPDERKPERRPVVAHRRFALLDGIVLVAACGIGVRVQQAVHELQAEHPMRGGALGPGTVIRGIRDRGFPGAPLHVFSWFEFAMPWLMTAAFALLAPRLVPPRPPTRRPRDRGDRRIDRGDLAGLAPRAHAPGAGGVVSADMASWSRKPVFLLTSLSAMAASGTAVASAGLVSFLGRSRHRADWIDRAGFVLGVSMIASTRSTSGFPCLIDTE